MDTGVADTSPPADANDGAARPMPCSSNTDCPADAGTPFCDTDGGLCVQCMSSADCTKSNALHCLNGFCGACAVASDCSDGGTGMVCNPFIPRCASACMFGTDCQSQGLVCNTMAGYCVECTDSSYCATSPNGTWCYTAAGVCGCQSDSDCVNSPSKPTCGALSPTRLRFCE
jgi:hypothetical protein